MIEDHHGPTSRPLNRSSRLGEADIELVESAKQREKQLGLRGDKASQTAGAANAKGLAWLN